MYFIITPKNRYTMNTNLLVIQDKSIFKFINVIVGTVNHLIIKHNLFEDKQQSIKLKYKI